MARMWNQQNMVRPGAYINIIGEAQYDNTYGERNVMTMPLNLDMGPVDELITVTKSQLLDNSIENVLGFTAEDTATDEAAKLVSLALSNCQTAILYRLNGTNGTKASYTYIDSSSKSEQFKIEATTVGIAGNNIEVKIVKNELDNSKLDVITYYKEKQKDIQTVDANISITDLKAAGDLTDNNFITISPIAPGAKLIEIATAILINGANGVSTIDTCAKLQVNEIVFKAKVAGVAGNAYKITCAVMSEGSNLELTIDDGSKTPEVFKDLNPSASIRDLINDGKINSALVDISGFGPLPVIATEALTGGSDGQSKIVAENGYFDLIKAKVFQCMALPVKNLPSNIKAKAKGVIADLRDKQGIKCQVVLEDYAGDSCNYEGVISCIQGFRTSEIEVYPYEFPAFVAGLTAGQQIYDSATGDAIDSATSIIAPNYKVYALKNAEIENYLKKGYFILTKNRNGVIKVEQDINSLHKPYPVDTNYSFSKNRVIRTLDEINNHIKDLWENQFMGKVSNNAKGRSLFKGVIIDYIRNLEIAETVQNFDVNDISVTAGTAIDAVRCDLYIQPVDSMEKLYMNIYVMNNTDFSEAE